MKSYKDLVLVKIIPWGNVLSNNVDLVEENTQVLLLFILFYSFLPRPVFNFLGVALPIRIGLLRRSCWPEL